MEFLAKARSLTQATTLSEPPNSGTKQRAGMQVNVWEKAEFMSCFGNQHLTTPCIQLVVSQKKKNGEQQSLPVSYGSVAQMLSGSSWEENKKGKKGITSFYYKGTIK